MELCDINRTCISIPASLIVFISGVPGVGKTTISYELLKKHSEFRIIEETDLIRETLRGYNEYLISLYDTKNLFQLENTEIYDHMKFLTYNEAKQQCKIMKKSLESIVVRQQRKGIPSIINGVHIVPEMLNGLASNKNVIYVNLFVNNEKDLLKRLANRNPEKYSAESIPLIFKTNTDLHIKTIGLSNQIGAIFNSIDVTSDTIEETLSKVSKCIKRRINLT